MVFNQINRVLWIPRPPSVFQTGICTQSLCFLKLQSLYIFAMHLKSENIYFKNGLFFCSHVEWPTYKYFNNPHLSLKADLPVITLCVASALETT